jgi:hypothetical protein
MVLVLMRVIGIGIETADMLVKEILSRREHEPREGARAIRKCSGAKRNDPTRVALPRVPEGERLGEMLLKLAPRAPAPRARK